MYRKFLIVCLVGVNGFFAPAMADVRELSQAEIRDNVRSGQSLSLARLMKAISTRTDAEVVDVRAFKADGIYYRVLLKKSGGQLTVAIVNARNGRFMSSRSDVVQDVMAAARNKGNSSNNGRRNSGGNSGNSNAGGNGNGNSGNAGGNGNSGGGNSGGGGKK